MLDAYLPSILNEFLLCVGANEADFNAFDLVKGIDAIFIAHFIQVFRCLNAIHPRHAILHENHLVVAYLLISWICCYQVKPLLHHVEGLRASDGTVSNGVMHFEKYLQHSCLEFLIVDDQDFW